MLHRIFLVSLFFLTAGGVLAAQKASDPSHRYFRLICLVHLKGSGQSGDAIVPEYVVEGTAAARAGQEAAATAAASLNGAGQQPAGLTPAAGAEPSAAAPISSRPGILAWSMLKSDDGTMAIIQVVAVDRHAFDSILADKRSEIRVFEIGKDKPEIIQNELRKFRKDFDLQNFQVVAQ
jgi:hypothetical protein